MRLFYDELIEPKMGDLCPKLDCRYQFAEGDRTYSVAVNAFVGAGNDGYTMLGADKVATVVETGMPAVTMLVEYVKKGAVDVTGATHEDGTGAIHPNEFRTAAAGLPCDEGVGR